MGGHRHAGAKALRRRFTPCRPGHLDTLYPGRLYINLYLHSNSLKLEQQVNASDITEYGPGEPLQHVTRPSCSGSSGVAVADHVTFGALIAPARVD